MNKNCLMGKPHLLVMPFPAQGHVLPFMELSECLALEGFKITFVLTEFVHTRVMNVMADKGLKVAEHINLLSIPDGLEVWEDRNDLGILCESMVKVMPGKLEDLMKRINETDSDKITCVLVDLNLGWALSVAAELKIHRIAVWPASAALLLLICSGQKLIDDGIINQNGTPVGTDPIKLAPDMPEMNPAHLAWACIGDRATQKKIFDSAMLARNSYKYAEKVICNTTFDFEPAALKMDPKVISIGPRLASDRGANPQGHFWSEDSSCLEWLDKQADNSVIYIAFGSFTVFDKSQFFELAHGLELTGMPFLWVVRPDTMDGSDTMYPEGFEESVSGRGRLIGWASQQKVLSHPAIACFISHCGWNSTIEGVYSGVPFLCWPYFADQFLNETYICDFWKIGLRLEKDDNGIISRNEIKTKVTTLLADTNFKHRALDLKSKATGSIKEGGSSHNNFQEVIRWLKSLGV